MKGRSEYIRVFGLNLGLSNKKIFFNFKSNLNIIEVKSIANIELKIIIK